jgi:GAF domain-containing protein
VRSNFNELNQTSEQNLRQMASRLARNLERDQLVQQITSNLQATLQVDRVVLYYFYKQWKGQVTFEALSDPRLSIFGSTGADECFNDDYAALYLDGRVRAIADVETEPIQPCHREFLQQIQVRANLVVPILVEQKLWGLLIAHHCHSPWAWSERDIQLMQQAAQKLSESSAIQ